MNKKEFADLYIQKAHYAFNSWGAKAKTRQLEQQNPHLTDLVTGSDDKSEQLDLLSINKAAQTLSSEIHLDKLIVTMMRLVMENAGAQRGLLILTKEDQWAIKAEVDTDEIRFPNTDKQSTGPSEKDCLKLPVAIVNYVIRTQQTVVLDDAARKGEFSADPYIFKNKPRSILCKPLTNRSQTIGVLYMENNLSNKTFTSDRQAALDILSSHIAISLYNAMLFDSVNKEIIERKEAENDLKKSIEMNRSILSSAMDGIITINENGLIQTFNPAAERIFGYQSGEVIGRNINILIPEPYKSEHDSYIQSYLNTGESKVLGLLREVPGRHKDGTAIPMEVSISKMPHDDKFMFVGMVRDISIRKKTEEELGAYREHLEDLVKQKTLDLKSAKEIAENANKAKSDFLSRVSHELRTPLNAILGFSQLMGMNPDQNLTEDQKINVDHILKAGKHLLELVDEVLDLSKIESGDFIITEENLNATLIIGELIAQTQPFADERNIKIINNLSQQKSHYIRGDHTAFSQIMLNLLTNAVKYNNQGGSITVDGGEHDLDNTWFSVSDTGHGISTDNLEALFEPFNRLGQEYGEIEGTGIGLSISKRLVELMGGSISAENAPKEGSIFKIILPTGSMVLTNIEEFQTQPTRSTNNIQPRNHKILYIEDNPYNLNLIEKVLKQKEEVTFLSATHPRSGIEIARTHRPDLILMDIHLPEMDGIAVFHELKKYPETCDIPVIAISAQAMKKDISKAMNSGFKDYLAKPIDIPDFISKIDNFFDL